MACCRFIKPFIIFLKCNLEAFRRIKFPSSFPAIRYSCLCKCAPYRNYIVIILQYCSLVLTLPFGGVGNSGFGSYHGKFGFDAFTHKKACYVTTSITEPLMGYVSCYSNPVLC